MGSLEEIYGIKSNKLPLRQVECLSTMANGKKRVLEVFNAPSKGLLVQIDFPEFTCKCPRTGHPDFATINLTYMPVEVCVELKALKYYLNSFRDEGHFHEEVISLIYEDLTTVLGLDTKDIRLVGEFNVRGGTYPVIIKGSL